MPDYSAAFFDLLESGSRRSAEVVVPLLLDLAGPASVVDVGCGRGQWLAVVRECGIQDVFGLDGRDVDTTRLAIPPECFREVDLSTGFSIERRFDLVLCLEVAEHLPASRAERFLDCLTALGPVVAFSAAIPHQGGVHHVNEQWPDYWIRRFDDRGYRSFDPIRAGIWDNASVEYWYAQNLLVFVAADAVDRLPGLASGRLTASDPPALVHPRRYLELHEEAVAARESIVELEAAFRRLERARSDWQKTAEQLEWSSKPENMSLRAVLRALPKVIAAAATRRVRNFVRGPIDTH
jgi:SAM-dependent methyltransferase